MSRSDHFDRSDFRARYARPEISLEPAASGPASTPAPPTEARPRASAGPPPNLSWPIARPQLHRVGDSVLADRDGHGRPHKGIDLFAEPGTPVRSAQHGRVLRVVDGRIGSSLSQLRAGLFIDVLGADGRVYRFLHLGQVQVKPGERVNQGDVLGSIAAAHTSGLREAPHLHFEIRLADVDSGRKDYGTPVDPLRLLPPLRA